MAGYLGCLVNSMKHGKSRRLSSTLMKVCPLSLSIQEIYERRRGVRKPGKDEAGLKVKTVVQTTEKQESRDFARIINAKV